MITGTFTGTFSGKTLIAAHVSRVPVACFVAAEAAETLFNPSFILVAIIVDAISIRGAIKAILNLPASLYVITNGATK